MITQNKFSKLRPEALGDDWMFEFQRDGSYDAGFLGGLYDVYESHGVELAFGSKVPTKPAFVRIESINEEQRKATFGNLDMSNAFVEGLDLPCRLLMSLDELSAAMPGLTDRGNGGFYAEFEWSLMRFFVQEDQLTSIELFDVERCQKNSYSTNDGKLCVWDVLTQKLPLVPKAN